MDKVGVGRGEELLGALWFCLRAEDCRAVVHRRRPREPSLPSLSQSVSSSVLFRSRSLSDHLRHGRAPSARPPTAPRASPLIPRGSRDFSVPSLPCKLRGGGTMASVRSWLCAKSGFKCFPCILWRDLQQKWRCRPAPALLS